jgi:hypothetical protein
LRKATSWLCNSTSGRIISLQWLSIQQELRFRKPKISLFKCPKGEFKGSLNFVAIGETLADQQGRFSLPWPSKRVCLQAKSLGMNLLQIEVLRDANAGELQVKLVPGT